MKTLPVLVCGLVGMGFWACGGSDNTSLSAGRGAGGAAGFGGQAAGAGGASSGAGGALGGTGGAAAGAGGMPAAAGGLPAGTGGLPAGAGGVPAGSGGAAFDGGAGGVTTDGGTGGATTDGGGGTPADGGALPDGGGPGPLDGGGMTDGTTPPTGDSGSTGQPPADGSQLATCQGNSDCNMGLACYTFGGYCSQECGSDMDCENLTGATYTCYMPGGGGGGGGTGVCRVECTGADDTTSCPGGMSCVYVGFGGIYRCAYDAPTADGGGGSTAAFGECQSDADCAAGLSCTAFNGGNGYCTQSCQDSSDCTETPSSGSVSATCGGFGLCTLDCAGDAGACPDSMECQMFGGQFAFCNYP